MEKTRLKDINFFTTYTCNSRCQNCQIWKGDLAPLEGEELRGTDHEQLFSDPLFENCSSIGLAGGEPTISPYFWELMESLPDEKRVTITTNALNSKRLVDFLENRDDKSRYIIQLSLDGIGEVNDRIRGVQGAFQKTLHLLERLENSGVDRLISFTMNHLNYRQTEDCYKLACDHGAEFSTRMAYIGGAYSNRENRGIVRFRDHELAYLDEAIHSIIVREIKRPSHSPARLVFFDKIVDYYRGKQKNVRCFALETGMVIDLYGDVFPNCPAIMTPIGNLHGARLEDIWQSASAEKSRKAIEKFECGGCWNDCQVVTNISMDRDFLEEEYARLKVSALGLEGLFIPASIDFDLPDRSLLLTGWYDLEGDSGFHYRWTEQQFSLLIPGGTSSLEIFAMFPDHVPDENRTMELFIGVEKRGTLVPDGCGWKSFCILLSSPVTHVTPCHFRLGGTYCPRESGMGEDLRRLGIAVHKITFNG